MTDTQDTASAVERWLKRRVPPVAYPPPSYTGRAS
jgi:hypothetical protein